MILHLDLSLFICLTLLENFLICFLFLLCFVFLEFLFTFVVPIVTFPFQVPDTLFPLVVSNFPAPCFCRPNLLCFILNFEPLFCPFLSHLLHFLSFIFPLVRCLLFSFVRTGCLPNPNNNPLPMPAKCLCFTIPLLSSLELNTFTKDGLSFWGKTKFLLFILFDLTCSEQERTNKIRL